MVQDAVLRALEQVIGEPGAKALVHYAKRHGYVEGDISKLGALESAVRELFGTGSSFIVRAVESEVSSTLGTKLSRKHSSGLSVLATRIVKTRLAGNLQATPGGKSTDGGRLSNED